MLSTRHKILSIAVLGGIALAPALATVPQALTTPTAYAETGEHTSTLLASQRFTANADYELATTETDGFKATSLAELKARAEAKRQQKLQDKAISMRTKLLAEAMRYKDVVPYVFGGSTPAGWDCSGYTAYVYANALDISMAHSVNSQETLGKKVSEADAQPGDLVIMSNAKETNYHVGIYLGNGLMLNAPRPGLNTKISVAHYAAEDTLEYRNIIDPAIGYDKGDSYFSYSLDKLIATTNYYAQPAGWVAPAAGVAEAQSAAYIN